MATSVLLSHWWWPETWMIVFHFIYFFMDDTIFSWRHISILTNGWSPVLNQCSTISLLIMAFFSESNSCSSNSNIFVWCSVNLSAKHIWNLCLLILVLSECMTLDDFTSTNVHMFFGECHDYKYTSGKYLRHRTVINYPQFCFSVY